MGWFNHLLGRHNHRSEGILTTSNCYVPPRQTPINQFVKPKVPRMNICNLSIIINFFSIRFEVHFYLFMYTAFFKTGERLFVLVPSRPVLPCLVLLGLDLFGFLVIVNISYSIFDEYKYPSHFFICATNHQGHCADKLQPVLPKSRSMCASGLSWASQDNARRDKTGQGVASRQRDNTRWWHQDEKVSPWF